MGILNRNTILKERKRHDSIKNWIWVYFFLLLFEGAFRKWLFPGFAGPLLVVRDPIAIWILYLAWKQDIFPANVYSLAMILIGVFGFFTSATSHGNLLVAMYGVRIFVLHFPLVFVIGEAFTKSDVLRIGKTFLILSIPMTVLLFLQFVSPQSAWVNRGVGGDMSGAGFSGALGYYRPPGTFSFTNGTTLFYSLTGCFIFYFCLNYKEVNRALLGSSVIAFLFAIPLSISRGLFFQAVISFLFTIFFLLTRPKKIIPLLVAIVCAGVVFIAIYETLIFHEISDAFLQRFETANEVEGGIKGVLVHRYLGALWSALSDSSDLPLLGYGIGLGTNAGSAIMTGSMTFLISEGEWGRLIGELGPILGLAGIGLRILFALKLATVCIRKCFIGNALPWILLSFGFMTIIQAQWSQPTTLGFSILIAGLILGSIRSSTSDKKNESYFNRQLPIG